MPDDTLHNVAAAARYLGFGRSTLYRWLRDGTGPRSVKTGPRRDDRRLFPRAALDQWLRERGGSRLR